MEVIQINIRSSELLDHYWSGLDGGCRMLQIVKLCVPNLWSVILGYLDSTVSEAQHSQHWRHQSSSPQYALYKTTAGCLSVFRQSSGCAVLSLTGGTWCMHLIFTTSSGCSPFIGVRGEAEPVLVWREGGKPDPLAVPMGISPHYWSLSDCVVLCVFFYSWPSFSVEANSSDSLRNLQP